MYDPDSIESLLRNKNADIANVINKVRNVQTHEINKGRTQHGEYHHLFPLLRKYPTKFKEYMRMSTATFDYVLSNIEESLKKNWCNLNN